MKIPPFVHGAAIVLCCAAPVPAETPAADPANTAATETAANIDLAAQIAALNDPDYATRAAATDALLQNETLDLDALAAAAAKVKPLPPETRERLLYVAHHHTVRLLRFANFPVEGPGSIGIVQAVQTDPLPPDALEIRDGRPRAQRGLRAGTALRIGYRCAARLSRLRTPVAARSHRRPRRPATHGPDQPHHLPNHARPLCRR